MTEPTQAPTATATRPHVAIIGFTQHNYGAPWGHPDWEFWGLNDLHSVFEQYMPGCFTVDGAVRWFQLHRRGYLGKFGEYPGARDPEHGKWLTEQTCPIYMWEHDPTIPASVPYPIQAVMGDPRLPTGEPLSPEQYYNNSISWMIALAIVLGFKTIGLYGVDMAMDGVHGESEYSSQRPSVEYFVGVARGLGIRVVMPQESEILKCAFLYGWDNKSHVRKKLLTRYEGLQQDEGTAVDAYENAKRAQFLVRGALQLLAGETQAPIVERVRAAIPSELLKEAVGALQNDEGIATNEIEAAKRSLHEVRGAKNNTAWLLRNYFPGEGPVQDVPRTDNSVLLEPVATDPPPSDGKAPVTADAGTNRVMALVKE